MACSLNDSNLYKKNKKNRPFLGKVRYSKHSYPATNKN